jgi:hypothetical protein
VNSFRIVFNQFLGANFERLPDRIYAHTGYGSLYDYFDVTDIVRGEGGGSPPLQSPAQPGL